MEGLSLAFDSDELLEFLRRECSSKEPILRHQALFTLSRFLPGYTQRWLGLKEVSGGLWTRYDQGAVGFSVGPGTGARPQAGRAAVEALKVLEPIARETWSLYLRGSPRIRSLALLALMRFPYPFVKEGVTQRLAGGEGRFPDVLLLASLRDPDDEDTPFGDWICRGSKRREDLLMFLTVQPLEYSRRLIGQIVDSVSGYGRVNVALSLALRGWPEVSELVERLLRAGEDWVAVYALRALESSGNEDSVGQILSIYDRYENKFVRAQALRSVGRFRCSASVELCTRALRDTDVNLHAQALESLVRLRCPEEMLSRVAASHLGSSSLRARVNAILATHDSEANVVPESVMALLMSPHVLPRLEGAYCLGYIQNSRALDCLKVLASSEPQLAVRIQAIKSLSKYPASGVLDLLATLSNREEISIATTAVRVMARYGGHDAISACDAAVRAFEESRSPPARAALLAALGPLTHRSHLPQARRVIEGALWDDDPQVKAAAIRAWTFLGEPVGNLADGLETLSRHEDPRVVSAALTARFLAGHESVVSDVLDRLRGDGEDDRRAGLACVGDLAVLVGLDGVADRFKGLATRLSRQDGAGGEHAAFGPIVAIPSLFSQAVRSEPAGLDLEEGEFDVHRDPRLDKGPSISSRRNRDPLLHEAQDEIVEDLKRHLCGTEVLDAVSENVTEGLGQETYVIGTNVPDVEHSEEARHLESTESIDLTSSDGTHAEPLPARVKTPIAATVPTATSTGISPIDQTPGNEAPEVPMEVPIWVQVILGVLAALVGVLLAAVLFSPSNL